MDYINLKQERKVMLLQLELQRLAYWWWLLLAGVAIGLLLVLCAAFACYQLLEEKHAAFERKMQESHLEFTAEVNDLTAAQTELILNLSETIDVLDQLEELRRVGNGNIGRDIGGRDKDGG